MEQFSTLMEQIRHNQHQHPQLVKKACDTLLIEAKQHHDAYEEAFAHTYLADYYMQKRFHKNCLQHLKIAQEIAEKNAYHELLILCYNLYGIYHNSHFDEITAVNYYVDAYHLAKESQNLEDIMITLNNLSTLFSQKEDYKEALQYLERAYHTFLKKGGMICSHRDLLVILNLIQLYIFNDRVEDAKELYDKYRQQLSAYDKEKLSIHVILLCTMYLAHAQGDLDTVLACTDTLLQEDVKNQHNIMVYFAIYSDVYDIMLSIEDKQRAEQLLRVLGNLCLETDIEQQLKLHHNWILFAETFHLEETLIQAYKQYYLLQKLVNDHTNRSKSESMKEKILMNHMIKERAIMEQEKRELETKVKTDELTGLFNRRYFRTLADTMKENPHVNSLGYIIIDIDNFKEYNDFYGHYQGDLLLRNVASCLDEHTDSRFFVARYGGDEFICLCVNVQATEIETYLQAVYQSLKDLSIEHCASDVCAIASISAGYTIVSMDDDYQYETALVMADTALYQAKLAGKATYQHV